MSIYTPYVYLIGWSHLDEYYIGSRYANNKRETAHPSDLWTTYFTSSDKIKYYRVAHGEPDVFLVIKTFSRAGAARDHESKILQRLDARNHPKLINSHNNDGFGPKIIRITNGAKETLIDDLTNIPFGWTRGRCDSFKQKQTIAISGNKHTEESKHKIGEQRTGTYWATDGVNERFMKPSESIPEGWRRGRNNSSKQKCLEALLPIRPTLDSNKKRSAKMKSKIWVTDGTISRRVSNDSPMPVGFRPGRASSYSS